MCKYNYSEGKCANVDVHTYFCVGERNCSISEILRSRNVREHSENNFWQPLSTKVWNIGKRNIER